MTIQERMEELIKAGATISVHFPNEIGAHSMLLAGVAWLREPTRLRWCAVFPEHDGHFHETHYDNAALVAGGRDVAFYAGERLIVHVCPYEESGGNLNVLRDTLIEWRNLLDKYNNTAKFEEMISTPREEE